MTPSEALELVEQALFAVAPDLADEPLDPDQPLRRQVEFDSMDLMHFVVELGRLGGIEIPESDYPELLSLHGAARYLAQRAGSTQRP